MIGRLIDMAKSLDGKLRATFELEYSDGLSDMEGELDIQIKQYKKKRSLDANAYFHVLVGKIADEVRSSKTEVKNWLLGDYGQREIDEHGPVVIAAAPDIDMMKREDIHCKLTGYDGKYRLWSVIRPTHTYDRHEMAVLIDGAVQEAKNVGVETLTPLEIERMMKAWERRYRNPKDASGIRDSGMM